ncbi:MAG: hypothetical protein M0019_06235 [Actinomycetota bacterium]|nr:hypothetical protein [Actinomycetota bacterium]
MENEKNLLSFLSQSRRTKGDVRGKSVVPLLLGSSAVALLASSCGLSHYNFFNFTNSSGADMYFKVPQSWSNFGPKDVYSTPQMTLSASQLASIETGNWATVFTAQRATSLSSLTGIFSNVPFGISQATKLSASQRDSFSLATIRKLLLPVDPLSSSNSVGGVTYASQSYNEFVTASGMRGSRMVVYVKQSGKPTAVLDQVAEVDANTNWVYLIGVGCDLKCFNSNKSTIQTIVNSWSVKER